MIVKRMVGDKPNAPLEQYIVETVDDLSEIISDAEGPMDITRTLPFGSIAFVIDNKTFYMVGFDSNNNKTWIDISESSSGKPEQSKTVTPTKSGVTVRPDTGYALSSVEVEPIPDQYPDVSDVTATAGTVLTGSDFVDASGTLVHGSCDYDADTSDATATAGQIEAGATAYVGGAKVTGTMPIRTTDVEIDSLSPVPIPAGSYDGTAMARLADPAEVDAQYILQNHTILGVQGQAEAKVDPTIGYVFEDFDSDGYPTTGRFVGAWSEINGYFAFMFHPTSYGKNIHSVTIPRGVTVLKNNAFWNCTTLTELNLPDTLTTIQGNTTFLAVPAPITIPASFTTWVGTQQFMQYGGKTIVFEGHCPSIPSACFNGATKVELYDFSHCTSIPPLFNLTSLAHAVGCVIRIPTALSDQTLGTGNGWESATNWSGLTNVVWEVV